MKHRLRITIYGPYGDYAPRLRNIAQVIRKIHKFQDCHIVADRPYRSDETIDSSILLTEKSYHYLSNSHEIIFIFFCDSEVKVAHQESPAIEFKHMKDNLPERKSLLLNLER